VTHFWKWLALSAAAAGLAYGALIGLTALSLPWRPAHFDTQLANTTQRGWVNEGRYFVLNQHAFAEPGDRVVVLGASTARDPFRPELMEAHLPGWQVANAALSGAAVSELGDAVDLYYQERRPGSGRTVFVFALTYLQFVPKTFPQGVDNPLAREAARGGLYAREDGALRAQYSRPVSTALNAVMRPQAVAASLPRRTFTAVFANPHLPLIKGLVDRFRGGDPLSRWVKHIGEQSDLDDITVPLSVQQALLAQRLAEAGGDRTLPPDEFRRLAAIVATIRAHGDAVVFVDLPLPGWHRSGVPLADRSYQSGVQALLTQYAGDPSVGFISLRAFDEDENFFDSGHTEPRLWPVLSARLAQDLAASPALRPTR
jgi:hypothetical protein